MSVLSARDSDQAEIAELSIQQTQLVADILRGTIKRNEKILQLAQLIERRYELGDFTLPISEICTYITRFFKDKDPSLAHNVRTFLPEKYKNLNQMRFNKLSSLINVIEDRAESERDRIEDFSRDDLLPASDHEKAEKNRTDDLATEVKKLITWRNDRLERVRSRALDLGINTLGDDSLRRPISERDYRYEIPPYLGYAELKGEFDRYTSRYIVAMQKFKQKYLECPPPSRQEIYRDAHVMRSLGNVILAINEDKWSGDLSFWFDREYFKQTQSAHDAGNSTKFPTTLCKHCSRDVHLDPKDFHRMKYWRPSPTGFICDNCGGTEILPRENTREQVGDKEPNVLRDAADLLNHIPHYADMMISYRNRAKNPEIYARKYAISNEFRIASMGKEKIVVPYREIPPSNG